MRLCFIVLMFGLSLLNTLAVVTVEWNRHRNGVRLQRELDALKARVEAVCVDKE